MMQFRTLVAVSARLSLHQLRAASTLLLRQTMAHAFMIGDSMHHFDSQAFGLLCRLAEEAGGEVLYSAEQLLMMANDRDVNNFFAPATVTSQTVTSTPATRTIGTSELGTGWLMLCKVHIHAIEAGKIADDDAWG